MTVSLAVALAFGGILKFDQRRAGGVGETGDYFRGDGLSFDRVWPLRMGRCPDTLFETIEGKLAGLEYSVPHGEAAASPCADFAFDHDFIVKAARHDEARAYVDDGQTDDAVFLPHR